MSESVLSRTPFESRSPDYSAEDALRDQREIVAMIARGDDLHSVLREIALFAERRAPGGMAVNIMVYDASTDGLLSSGGQPSLPDEFLAAIQGLRPGPAVGSCGTAAYRREQVITEDVVGDELWVGFDELMVANGYRASWSTPIIDPAGELLGTFGMYYPTVRTPTDYELELIDLFVYLAALAIERDRSDQRLRHLADHDWLTGALNRRAFLERAQAELVGEPNSAVLFIGLESMGHLAESRGHEIADEALKRVCTALSEGVDEVSALARYSDDAVVALVGPIDQESVLDVAKRAREVVQAPLSLGGSATRLVAQVGVAVAEPGVSADALVRRADLARVLGHESVSSYDATVAEVARAESIMLESLRAALTDGGIGVAYQPIVDLASARIIGLEALARWSGGSPAEFIPLAERAGLIHELGISVLDQALSQMARWTASMPQLVLHVNLSPDQLLRPDLVDTVSALLMAHSVPPQQLSLELTEGEELADAQAIATLNALLTLGVRLSLDDFGTGYSSPGRLVALPFDTLKIDRSFVDALDGESNGINVARLLMAFGRELNLEVIAEGVETEEQRRVLQGMGCRAAQGFLFSRPVPAEEVDALVLSS